MPRDHHSVSTSDSDSNWDEELINAVRKKEGKSEAISEKDRIQRIQECLDEGAQVNAVNRQRNTALHIAVKKDFIEIVRFLINKGAKTDIKNRNGDTALTLAKVHGNEVILKALKGLPDRFYNQLSPQQTASSSQARSTNQQTASTSTDHHDTVQGTRKSLKRKATDDNEGKKNNQRRHTAEKENFSPGNDSQLNDETVDVGIRIRQQTSWSDGNNRYAAPQGLKNSLHGNIYQLKLLMLFVKRGLRHGYTFRLATEMEKAEKFDDLVFEYKIEPEIENSTGNKTVCRFLQAKHKQNETKEKISYSDLVTENDDEFSLQKYFISYCKIKRNFRPGSTTFKDFIICTNIDFDYESLESAHICLTEIDEPDVFLNIKGTKEQAARYMLNVDERSELYEILKRTTDLHRLAKILVEHVYESKNITLKNDLFKLYHTALAEEIIDVKNKRFFDKFVKGENLSERGNNFREIFCAEASKRLTKLLKKDSSEADIWNEMTKNPLKVSSNFGKRIELVTNPTLNPLEEFSEELVKLINNADNDNLVKVDGTKYRKNAKEGSREKVFADNIAKLVGHVLIVENEKIKFRSQFFHNDNLPGNLEDFRNLLKNKLGTIYDKLERYHFKMPDSFKTCEEEQLDSKTELPNDEIDSEEIKDFFAKLIFAVNQPNEIELGDLITSEIGAELNLLNADLVGASFQKEILDWFKRKGKEKGQEGSFYSHEDAEDFFDSAKQMVNDLVTSGLSLSYREELEAYGGEFENENNVLRDFLTSVSSYGKESALNLIATEATLPTAIRVHQAIRQTGKYEKNDSLMFLRLSTLLLPKIKERVILAFNSRNCHQLLVIDCESKRKEDLQDLYDRFRQTTKENIDKKLIFITLTNESLADVSNVHSKNCCILSDDVSFEHLTKKSQFKLMGKEIINFQGQKQLTSFEKLLDISGCDDIIMQEMGSAIDTRTLVKLICHKEFKVGNDLDGSEVIEKYYIHRIINRQVFIKNNVFESKSGSNVFAISTAEDYVPGYQGIILESGEEAEQFKKLCIRSPKNVHWLRYVRGEYIWYQSRGDITILNKYRDVSVRPRSTDHNIHDEYDSFLMEDRLADHDEEQKIIIISDSPGMGKTTMFTYLTKKIKEKTPGQWVLRIELNDFTKVLDQELQDKQLERESFDGSDIDRAVEFFVEKLSRLETKLDKKVLKTMMKNRSKIVLLFDGFDEISPKYTSTVIDLLEGFKKLGVAKLFVATRPHMRQILEDKLGKFSFAMEQFSDEDRINFLIRFWKAGLGLNDVEERIEQRLKIYAKSLMKQLVESINETAKEVASVPVQIRMIAELFQSDEGSRVGIERSESCQEFLLSKSDEPKLRLKLNIVDLYRGFVDKKYNIYSAEKKEENPTNLGVQDDSEDLREIFLKRHQMLALHTLFDQHLLNHQEIKLIDAYMTKIIEGRERTGIITHVANERAQFIHRTFAEYFVALFLSNTLLKQADHDSNVRQFIVKQILFETQNRVIRAFLNGLLLDTSSRSDGQYAGNAVANVAWKFDLCKYGHQGNSIFHTAAREGNYEIIKFLLNRIDQHETRKDLISVPAYDNGDTVLRIVANYQQWNELIWLIENEGAEVNSSIGNGRTVLHAAASRDNLDVVIWLVEKGARIDAPDDDDRTPLHEAVQFGKLSILEWLVNREEFDINHRNKTGKTLLHYAASASRLDVVKWLVNTKNVDYNIGWNDRNTALHEAAHCDDRLRSLIGSKLDEKLGVFVTGKSGKRYSKLDNYDSRKKWAVVEWLVKNTDADVNIENSQGETILHDAVRMEQWDLVKFLVEKKNVSVNLVCQEGRTILHYAALDEQWDLVNWLMEDWRGADVHIEDNSGKTVLHYAAAFGQFDLVKCVFARRGSDISVKTGSGMTLLHCAASSGFIPLIKWLVDEKGADVEARNNDGETVLLTAARSKQWDVVKLLIDSYNADVHVEAKSGDMVLFHAARSDNVDVIEWLEDHKDIDVNATSTDGRSILYEAVLAGSLNVVEWMIDMGADPNTVGYAGCTIIHVAVEVEQVEILEFLLDKGGGDIEARDKDGNTPLHIAASMESDMIETLVQTYDADIHATNNKGEAPRDLYDDDGPDLEFLELERWTRTRAMRNADRDYDEDGLFYYSPGQPVHRAW